MASQVVINLPAAPVQRLDSVATIAALRALASMGLVNGEDIAVDGSTVLGDGGGGLFVWNPTSLLADDGATIIKPSDLTNLQAGRWILTGVTPTNAAIAAALQYRRPTVSGNVPHNLQQIVSGAEWANVYEWLTDAEIAACAAYTSTADLTSKIQQAMDETWRTNVNLFIPAGLYNVGTLVLPGNGPGRPKAWKLYGQGSGEIFARAFTGGTILKAIGTASILTNIQSQPMSLAGNGNQEYAYMRLEGNSSTPVVDLATLYAQSEFHHNCVYQGGTGNGFQCAMSNTAAVHHNYFINRDWAVNGLGVARVGVGFYMYEVLSTGLTDVHNNTSRGFLTAYRFGDSGGNRLYSLRVEHNECSVNYNGMILTASVQGASIANNYLEGGDGGTAFADQGAYNNIERNLVFAGFSKGIDASLQVRGGRYVGNVLSAGSFAGTSLAVLAAECEFRGNTLTFSGSGGTITGVIGVQIIVGSSPRISGLSDNVFDPGGMWIGGAGTAKISDSSTGGGVVGVTLGTNVNYQFPVLSRGAVAWFKQDAIGDGAIVSSTQLDLTRGGTYFPCTFTAPGTAIDRLLCGTLDSREIMLRLSNNNRKIVNSTYIKTNGGTDFVGPGTITLVVERVGADSIAYEKGRATYV